MRKAQIIILSLSFLSFTPAQSFSQRAGSEDAAPSANGIVGKHAVIAIAPTHAPPLGRTFVARILKVDSPDQESITRIVVEPSTAQGGQFNEVLSTPEVISIKVGGCQYELDKGSNTLICKNQKHFQVSQQRIRKRQELVERDRREAEIARRVKERCEAAESELQAERTKRREAEHTLRAERDKLELDNNAFLAEREKLEQAQRELLAEREKLEQAQHALLAEREKLEQAQRELLAEREKLEDAARVALSPQNAQTADPADKTSNPDFLTSIGSSFLEHAPELIIEIIKYSISSNMSTSSNSQSSNKSVYVGGYYTKNGTYVPPYYRSAPRK